MMFYGGHENEMTTSQTLPMVFCFAGQGAQYFHMGRTVFDEHATFRKWMLIGNEVVRDRHGYSVIDAIYDSERRLGELFDRLEETHPAIFMIQYALAQFLLGEGLRPNRLFGVSLGEITAMAVADMATFEPVLRSVSDQPAIYRRTCDPGGMVAVLGPTSLYDELPGVAEMSEIAGINAGEHFVLSAPSEALGDLESALRSRDVIFQRLPVPFAFHSRWIDPARAACQELFTLAHRKPLWPCWSSSTSGPITADSEDLRWKIVREKMDVRGTIQSIEAEGGAIYIDLSPSGTLAAILPQVFLPESRSKAFPILSPYGGVEKRLAKVLDFVGRGAQGTEDGHYRLPTE